MRSRTSIGENIRNLRVNRGWTRGQLAEALGVRPRHISAFELGTIKPSRVGIQHLAEALGVEDADLQNGLLRALPAPRLIKPVYKINALRKALDWTRAQLAQALGISLWDLWRFESGEVMLSQEHLEAWAKAIEVSMDGLVRCLEAPWENNTPAKPRPGRLLQRDGADGLEPMTQGSTIGALILRLRTKQGTSQSVLAGQVGLSRAALGKIEAGRARPDAATRKLLAFFLDVQEVELGGPLASGASGDSNKK